MGVSFDQHIADCMAAEGLLRDNDRIIRNAEDEAVGMWHDDEADPALIIKVSRRRLESIEMSPDLYNQYATRPDKEEALVEFNCIVNGGFHGAWADWRLDNAFRIAAAMEERDGVPFEY